MKVAQKILEGGSRTLKKPSNGQKDPSPPPHRIYSFYEDLHHGSKSYDSYTPLLLSLKTGLHKPQELNQLLEPRVLGLFLWPRFPGLTQCAPPHYAGVGQSKCLDPDGDVLGTKCASPDFTCAFSEMSSGGYLHLEYIAANPYAPNVPTDRDSIRGDFSLKIKDKSGRCEEFEYTLDASHSQYPSHEVFIGDTNVYFALATGSAQTHIPLPNHSASVNGVARPNDRITYPYNSALHLGQ